MDTQYDGPKIMESYLMKKKMKSKINTEERVDLRYFKFSLIDKNFIYKDDEDTKEIKMIYTGKDLQLCIETVEKDDQDICDFPFGFQIITSGKSFVLFAQTKEIYTKWIRILNFHFNKIDILNPMDYLSSQNSYNSEKNLKNNQTNNNKYYINLIKIQH